MEGKGTPEKDKFGKKGMLMWVTNQNVIDLKEAVNKYVQDGNAGEDLIKRLAVINDRLHDFWVQMSPS